jgi:excinuclease ABC subunit C
MLVGKTRQPEDWSVVRRHGPAAVGRLPDGPGVYRFRDAHGRVLYVGRASVLRSRVASYWSDLRGRDHLAAMVARVARIEAVSCDSVHEAAWLERNLLEASLPRWNRTAGGQESAVYVRLDARPKAPGLSAVYRADPAGQVRYFGPYLGGLRVRQAIAALHRILPVSYTKARLAGAERDMARIRGVARDDRGELICSLNAILDREPDAVGRARDQLEEHRDRAAREQAYELAARIQREIAGLEWITCSQRVRRCPGDVAARLWALFNLGQDRGNPPENVIDTFRDNGVHGFTDVEGVGDLRGVVRGWSQRDRGNHITGNSHHDAIRLGHLVVAAGQRDFLAPG